MEKLAINGGEKLIKNEFTPFNTYGPEEERAVLDVLKSGVLSKFLGEWGDDFFGGPKVREFEKKCEDYFSVKHAVTVNSWTSGLIAAVGAIDIEPGDEVIVTTMTMCASATAILHWNAIPVFADIDPETYNICTQSIEKNISPYTKAIMVADIFGQSADMESIMKIAKKNNLKVISDCAQAPGSLYKNKYSGTLADVGGFSLNYHKHIHTGEGGILVTDSDKIANKLRLIRNHGEAVIKSKGDNDLINIIGHNFRLGEIESALGIEQLKKLDKIIKKRQHIASRLRSGLKDLHGLNLPKIDVENTHVYYVFPMQIDESIT